MKVLKFIDKFSDTKEQFLNGKCYWFSVILTIAFFGKQYYNPIMNHWATKIEGKFYDASGEISGEGFEEWPGQFPKDKLHYNRLIRQCIRFDEE